MQSQALLSVPKLSPLPVIRKPVSSPKKVSKHHNIFVSPHKVSQGLSPLAKRYVTQRSPATVRVGVGVGVWVDVVGVTQWNPATEHMGIDVRVCLWCVTYVIKEGVCHSAEPQSLYIYTYMHVQSIA